jgi:hypothetical protein
VISSSRPTASPRARRLSFNIARAYEKLGDDAGALRWFRDYLRRAPDAPICEGSGRLDHVLTSNASRKKGVQQLTVMSTPAVRPSPSMIARSA